MGDTVQPGSLRAVQCRLGVLEARIEGEDDLGKLRSKLGSTLDRAIDKLNDADAACTATDPKAAKRRMNATLRAELVAAIESVGVDAAALRGQPCA